MSRVLPCLSLHECHSLAGLKCCSFWDRDSVPEFPFSFRVVFASWIQTLFVSELYTNILLWPTLQTRLEHSPSTSSKRKRNGPEDQQQQGKLRVTERSTATNGFVLPDLNIPAQDIVDGSAVAAPWRLAPRPGPFLAVAPDANLISLLTVYRGKLEVEERTGFTALPHKKFSYV
jgi:hypothetical protein